MSIDILPSEGYNIRCVLTKHQLTGNKMEIDCNIHAASFVKGAKKTRYDRTAQLKNVLGLDGAFTFVYTYPLTKRATFDRALSPEMDGADILAFARADYETIYQAEETAVGNPGHIPGMLNRSKSDGPYGIWGHDLSDLYFEGISIDTDKKIVSFDMGS